MAEAYIVGAVRSAVGKRNGGLSAIHPADLAADVMRELVGRSRVPADDIDDVILGCVSQIGAQSTNIARIAALSAGLPISVPGTTIDRQCGSSQQAVHFAAQAIRSGDMDLVVAGGVEVMSLITIGAAAIAGPGHPRGGERWHERFGDQEISQFRGAELMADKWDISRTDMEEFALASHQRAVAAQEEGLFDEEIVAINGVSRDETPRANASLDALAALNPLTERGLLTAGVSSAISDGAAALMIASAAAVERLGLRPLARIHTAVVTGSDPVMMLSGPIDATARALHAAGLTLDEIDYYEVNEAFAPVVIAWIRETGASHDKTNILGGAISLGHPLGATGARLMTTLVHQLQRTGSRYGLQVMCEGGGMANATIIERM